MKAKAEGKVDIDSSNDEKPLSNRMKKKINKLSKQLEQHKNRLKFWRKK